MLPREMKLRSYVPPISPLYRKAAFEAMGLQALVGFLSLLVLDGGGMARICGIGFAAFWPAAALLILRRPTTPTPTDIALIRFGFLPVLVIAFFLTNFIWTARGVG